MKRAALILIAAALATLACSQGAQVTEQVTVESAESTATLPTPTITSEPSTPTVSPIPTITPAAGTPIPSATSVLSHITGDFSPILGGGGLPGAASFDPDGPWPYRMVILDASGEPHPWNDMLSTDWLATSIAEAQLVVILGEQRLERTGSREYSGGSPITGYRYLMDAQLRVARTGQILADGVVQGSSPKYPTFAPQNQTRVEGDPVTFAQLQQWLSILHRWLEGHTDSVRSVAFSADGQVLASGSADNTIRLWRVADGELLRTLEGHTDIVYSVAFSSDGQILASGSMDNTVRLWRVADGDLLHTLEGHTSSVLSVAFSPDGQTLASGSWGNTVCLWRVADGELLHTLEGHTSAVLSVAFSADGQTLATGSEDNTFRLWRVADGEQLRIYTDEYEGLYNLLKVAFMPDGQVLVASSPLYLGQGIVNDEGEVIEDYVRLWWLEGGVQSFSGLLHPIRGGVVVSPDFQFIAWISFSSQYYVCIFRVADGKLIYTQYGAANLYELSHLALSATGILAVWNDDSIHLWAIQELMKE